MTPPALSATRLVRTFRRRQGLVRAVDGVTLEVIPGEVVALVGPLGAGKTTVLRLCAGLLEPDAGSVSVARVRTGSRAARRLIGFAPDGAMFPPALTVREVLEYYARLHVRGPRRRALVSEALELGDLGGITHLRAASLSRSDAQRLCLAQAALGDRRVLLLDETLSGGDSLVRRTLCDRVARLAARGVAILLASTDVAAAERLAGRVLVMQRGKIAREGPLSVLLRERVLQVVLDGPPLETPPPGFRLTAAGAETDLGDASVEAALALCRAHRLSVRASSVRHKSLDDVVLETLDDGTR